MYIVINLQTYINPKMVVLFANSTSVATLPWAEVFLRERLLTGPSGMNQLFVALISPAENEDQNQ